MVSSCRIVFFGTSDFAASILKDIVGSPYELVAVVTRPDKPQGRSQKMSFSKVKECIQEMRLKIPVYQPGKVSTVEFQKVLEDLKPDLFVVAAFGEIIKPHILAIPRLGSINVHPSLLPKYRGPSPIQAALFAGDDQTAVCIIEVVEKMDAGPIYAKKMIEIDPSDNFTTLQEKCLFYTKELLLKVVEGKILNQLQPEFQDEALVTFCKKITPEMEKIDWSQSLLENHHKIRALSQKPGAWSFIKINDEVKRVKIFKTKFYSKIPENWEQAQKKRIFIIQDAACLEVLNLQLEGKKILDAAQFLSGIREKFTFF